MKPTYLQTYILQGADAAKCGGAIATHWLLENKNNPDAMGQIKPLPAHGDCVRLFLSPAGDDYLAVVKRFATGYGVEVHKDDPMLYGHHEGEK